VESRPISLTESLTLPLRQWQQFWFTPAAPHTLALIRILGGTMLFYTHLVWGKDLLAFLGPHAWVSRETARLMNGELNSGWAWSYLYYVESPALLWALHIAALVVFALLTVGLWTRVTSILACIITISYCHRLVGTQFGLDQVNALLATYLAIGPSGAVYSLDRLLATRGAGKALPVPPSIAANIAVRLIQVHMCVIYLFGGISKMRGETWWDGTAVWRALANYEYQSMDLTWLVHYPFLIALASHLTVFWETFYCVLIWPRVTRPFFLAMAVMVHGGIALFLGMMTFGLAMIIANLAFVPPEVVQGCIRAATNWLGECRGVSPTWNDESSTRRANAATLA
jgi:hypothetical protein